jgi:hypothetical protein
MKLKNNSEHSNFPTENSYSISEFLRVFFNNFQDNNGQIPPTMVPVIIENINSHIGRIRESAGALEFCGDVLPTSERLIGMMQILLDIETTSTCTLNTLMNLIENNSVVEDDAGDSKSHCLPKKRIYKKQQNEVSPLSPRSPKKRLKKAKSVIREVPQ